MGMENGVVNVNSKYGRTTNTISDFIHKKYTFMYVKQQVQSIAKITRNS